MKGKTTIASKQKQKREISTTEKKKKIGSERNTREDWRL